MFTLIGGAALIIGAFLNWTRAVTGDELSNHALVKTEFLTQSDIVKTVGGIAVLIGLVGLLGLVDRTGWLTRLAGALGIVLFVLFAVEVYRSSQHQVQTGAWIALAGAVVLVIAGFFGGREVIEVPTSVVEHTPGAVPEERIVERHVERTDADA
ncbi:MAG: sugar:proton symporter [Actinocrinis sp.]